VSQKRIGQGFHLLFGFALLSAGFLPYCLCAYFVEPIKRIVVVAATPPILDRAGFTPAG
jgi:hypothetical protein